MNYFMFVVGLLKCLVLILLSILIAIGKFFIPKRCFMKSVTNKIVLITGAGGGLGSVLAVKFAKRQARLVLWDINVEGLRSTVEQCRQYQSETLISTFKVDVSNRTQVLEAANKVKADIGFVDILINNAGVMQSKSILEMDEKSITKTFNVNVFSHFWTVQAFIPEMFARNSGHIVSIVSIAGLCGTNKLSDYCASKFAAIGFQESLLNEIRAEGKSGINCLTVCPYFMKTGMFEGVKSFNPILPILSVNYVATKIEEAILTNSSILYIPKIFYFLCVFKSILPMDGLLYLTDFTKTYDTTKHFYEKK